MAAKKQTKKRRLHVAILKQMVVLATGGFGLAVTVTIYLSGLIDRFKD